MMSTIAYSRSGSPAGPVYVAHRDGEPVAVRPAGDPARFESWIAERFGERPLLEELPEAVRSALDAALAGRPARPALDDLEEPERRVLLKTFDIPRGQVRSYAWVAAGLGRPGEAREVGAVLAENPLPLVVPCHRVVRSDGQLGWYNCGGTAAKRALLAHEGVDLDRIGELVRG